ncbi:MAG: exosortase system-associated protein, TIGR04073 family [Methylovulum sp.]|jgi:putative exosortase-associated protein (TIGR04073 family)|nr:exosortase system-associated protein, TIGR04073 family [Methylovulum sp.]TSA40616.1 MAG: exosortase system-associated protein, TIGR04073 family [Methylococcaceae bacterium]
MRKDNHFFALLLLTCLFAAYAPTTLAVQSPSYLSKVNAKALRTFANLITAPLEIPKNIINTTNKSNFFYGIVGGSLKGLLNTQGRLGAGIIDLLTLSVPTQPITQAVYIWDNFDVDTRYDSLFILDLGKK